ncbi:MAG TPA: citrate/2-methylcitrate synthase [Clostridia bacterium]|jgi:citrate synthase|nr:citrate/2-methylcitrate synthase [Clostridia bacterium]
MSNNTSGIFTETELKSRIKSLAMTAYKNSLIDPSLYEVHDTKRGLRDLDGKGVVVGLTNISTIFAKKEINGQTIPIDGELYYRGYLIDSLVKGFVSEGRFGFEEISYLLMFGKLPTKQELNDFCTLLGSYRSLPLSFVRDVIMKRPSVDMMNVLQRSVLTLYAYDDNPDGLSIENVLKQLLKLVSRFPLLSVYGYQVYKHYYDDGTLVIHQPKPELSTAENILHLLRKDSKYTPLEAKILDLCLVLHAEHGGGNNSTFTTHVVSSTGTDTYSAIAASLGSLKGPRHGGANVKVVEMMNAIKENSNIKKDADLRDYLVKILDKKAYDKTGLIYGMGHAIYTKSDPRARILKSFAKQLAEEKGLEEEYELYKKVEEISLQVIPEKRKIYKGVCANVDFYSGFIYKMLNIPIELYTPIFAIARIPGWSAHRIEEISNMGKIIRPAYDAVSDMHKYVKMSKRSDK